MNKQILSGKIRIVGDSVLYDDNQIGFFVDDNEIKTSLTDEDLENGEFSMDMRNEIVQNRALIISYLRGLGYKLIVEEEDE